MTPFDGYVRAQLRLRNGKTGPTDITFSSGALSGNGLL